MRIPKARASTWETIFGVAYLIVMLNAMMLVAAFPLVLLLLTTDPRSSWPALALAAVGAFPALTAAAGVFAEFTDHRETSVLRVFWRTWWRRLGRSLLLGVMAVGLLTIIALDVVWLWGRTVGAVAIPMLAMAALLVCTTTPLAIVASAEREDARLRDVLKASLFLGVRRWYLTLLSVVIAGLLWTLFTQYPAIAIGLAVSPLLYGIWANARYSLRPVLRESEPVAA